MHNVLILLCSVPTFAACAQYVRMRRALRLLKELILFFDRSCVFLQASAIEIYSLLALLQEHDICPSLCALIRSDMEDELSFEQAWVKSIKQYCRFLLSDSDIAVIAMFGKQFGFGSLDNQLALCQRYADICHEILTEKKTSIENNGKLSLTCSVLLGAFLYIVLM